MGYLGPEPKFGHLVYQDLTTDANWGSQSDYTLKHPVPSEPSILVIVGGVIQEPGIGFTLTSQNTISLSEIPNSQTSGYVIFLGERFALPNVADGGVSLSKLNAEVLSKLELTNPEIFTTNGTYTVPAGITELMIEAVGGGAGGGGGTGAFKGAGGGSGAKIRAVITVTPGSNITVTIGSAGSGGTSGGNGTAGGNTTFGSAVTAGGGNGGGGTSGNTSHGTGGSRGVGTTTGTKLEERGQAGISGEGSRKGGNPENNDGYTGIGLAGNGGNFSQSGTNGQPGGLIVTPLRES